jgi:hypothetical protein
MGKTGAAIIVTAVVMLASAAGAAFVHAQSEQRGMRDGRQGRFDAIEQRDAERAQALDIEGRFGVRFEPHIAVCGEALEGEANCHSRVVTDETATPRASAKIIYGLTPVQLRAAYGVSGISSAYIQSDLDTYSATLGIPKLPACTGAIASSAAPCFKKVDQRGGTRYPSSNAGWALEIALDVEAAHALCQNCSILLVESDTNSFTNLMAAVDRAVALGATVVSNSYGASEFSGEVNYDSHFNRPGVAFTVSSGDSGYGTEYPAASRFVTAVGGTSLYFHPDGSYGQELAWGGAGSGCSKYQTKPSWQNDPDCPRRTIADVSAVADPNTGAAIYDSLSYFGRRGWWQVGGTSLAAPVVAAIYALSGNTSGAANQLPYALGTSSNLHDIISGSNGSCGGSYLCTSGFGYDGPTGLGSPNGSGAF